MEEVERRKETRYRLNKMLGLQLEGEDYSSELRVFVLDMSATGMRLTSQCELPLEQPLAFVLRLPDKLPSIKGQVSVRWQKFLKASGNHEAGLEFTELSTEHWRALREFVGTLLDQKEKVVENLSSPWHMGNLK